MTAESSDNNIGAIRPVNLTEEVRSAYLDYAMSVIVQRALPDVRDGLKPVQRRILYGMWDMGIRHNMQTKKSARIVGDVMGKMHPHGDASVYDALARLAQPWNMRYLLVDGQGNFGSIDGDPPAAQRYTEARLTEIAEELLRDIDKDTIDFKPNFDGTYQEPRVLPALVPNLLVNGSAGIAVGMATNLAPHNLREICAAIAYVIDNPEATVEDLMKIVPGPDFPTGAYILGTEGIINAYSTGRGHIYLRAKAHIEEGSRGAFLVVVTELPYQVNKARLHERIADLVKDKKIEGIRDVQDQSDRDGMRLVIFLKQDAQPKKVLNALYKHTQMQTTFGVNSLALTDNGIQPRVLSLKRMMQEYIEHRQNVIRRRTEFELAKAKARAHILEGLKIALDNLDAVIQTIRSSKSAEEARGNLMTRFSLSELQSQAILDMQLRRLAGLERQRIEDEYKEVIALIGELENILANSQRILAIIKDDLQRVSEKYGDDRRTRILTDVGNEVSDEDLIPDMRVLVTLTDRGYIKRQPWDTYRTQRRGGRGIKGMVTREQDVVRYILTCNTLDDLLFFTDKGKVYQVKAHLLPDAQRTAKGTPLVNLISLDPNEHVTSVLAVSDFGEGEYLVMATRNGKIKRTLLEEYSQVRSNGLIAIGLEENDQLGWVAMSNGDEDILITTKNGQTVRFAQKEARPMGRPASGVIGVNLVGDDQVVGMGLQKPGSDLLLVTERGFGKRTLVEEYPIKGRATQGVITIKLRPADSIAAAAVVTATSVITIITASGIVLRSMIGEISQLGRSTQGVTILKLGAGDYVTGICCEEVDPSMLLSDEEVIANGAEEDDVPTNGFEG